MSHFIQRALIILSIITSSAAATAHAEEYHQYSNLPTLYINTQNSVAITSKTEYVKATMVWVDGATVTKWENTLSIRGRGNSTWGMDKKPYRLKFDSKTSLLGKERAKAKSWTLLANYADKTLIRNAVAAFIGTRCGQPFTAAAQFVDVVLNDTFIGNYQISDQMEIRPGRVDITEQDKTPQAGDDISGGYFLEVDGFATGEPVWFSTNRGVKITIKSPDEEVIAPSQQQYIQSYINDFENTLFSDVFTDPVKGYRRFVDPSTLASWYIATELTGNVDGFWSTYIYKEKGDSLIYWGPLWDYDIAFNNCNRTGEVTNALMTERGFGDDLTKVWINRMWEDPWFANLINDTWKKIVADGIEAATLDYIDRTASLIDASQKLNFNLWPLNRRVYNEIVLFNTYQGGVDYLKKFVREHTAFLTRKFQQKVDDIANNTPTPTFDFDKGYTYRIVNKGTHKTTGLDATGTKICIHDGNPDAPTQEWILKPEGSGWYSIINYSTGQAVTDAAPLNGNSYGIGYNIAVDDYDSGNQRQHWAISPISTGLSYCLINRATSLAWNNSGGNSDDGTPILSWTNDSSNKDKTTRQWHLNRTTIIEYESGIDAPEIQDYVLVYDRATMTLRFDAAYGEPLTGDVYVYTTTGQMLLHADASKPIAVGHLTRGAYVVTWSINGRTHSVKAML